VAAEVWYGKRLKWRVAHKVNGQPVEFKSDKYRIHADLQLAQPKFTAGVAEGKGEKSFGQYDDLQLAKIACLQHACGQTRLSSNVHAFYGWESWLESYGNSVEGEVSVCAHRVSYRYEVGVRDVDEVMKETLEEEAESRAKHCITDGCVEGELNCVYNDEEVRGWWEIVRN
jgi:hypothetical protein